MAPAFPPAPSLLSPRHSCPAPPTRPPARPVARPRRLPARKHLRGRRAERRTQWLEHAWTWRWGRRGGPACFLLSLVQGDGESNPVEPLAPGTATRVMGDGRPSDTLPSCLVCVACVSSPLKAGSSEPVLQRESQTPPPLHVELHQLILDFARWVCDLSIFRWVCDLSVSALASPGCALAAPQRSRCRDEMHLQSSRPCSRHQWRPLRCSQQH
jgi:hypothetical protein